ncbi:MAG: TlpA disulfide reductase family protein [Patescibacteria group bacterium]
MKTGWQYKKILVQVAPVIVLGLLVCMVLLLGGASNTPETRLIPDVRLMDSGNQAVSLQDVLGNKPAVINAWASWCPYCTKELPDLVALQKEFGEDVKVIAINRAETHKSAIRYLEKIGAVGEITYLYDNNDEWYRAIGGYVMPETLFVDAMGKIIYHNRGPLNSEQLRERVRGLLNGATAVEPDPKSRKTLGCRDGACAE